MRKILFLIIFIFLFISSNNVGGIGSGGGGYIPTKSYEPNQKSALPENKKDIKSLTKDSLLYKNVVCNNLKDPNERIKCRLSKAEGDLKKETFLPEECRNLSGSKKIGCIKLYKEFYKCFEKKLDLDNCALKTVGLSGSNPSVWIKECQGKFKTPVTKCMEDVKNKFLNYLKFYLYHLSYKVEKIKELNRDKIDDIVNFIGVIETSKQNLNKASEKEINEIIDRIEIKWNELIKKLNLPKNFDKKSNLEELKTKYETLKNSNSINNIR